MQTDSVVACVVRSGSSVLLCKRPAHKRHGGLWEFPGGKIEHGETVLDAARRELLEELNVQVQAVDDELIRYHDPGSRFVIAFHYTTIKGTPLCLEHSELAWIDLEKTLSLPLAPCDERFVRFLLDQD